MRLYTVYTVKDLGDLDSYLTYDEHIQAISSSCLSKLGQISRVKHIFDESTLAKIIDTLVISTQLLHLPQYGPIRRI